MISLLYNYLPIDTTSVRTRPLVDVARVRWRSWGSRPKVLNGSAETGPVACIDLEEISAVCVN